MDLPPQLTEQALDRGVHVLVGVGNTAFAGDPVEGRGDLGQLLVGEQSGAAQALGVLLGRRAVVGQKLAIRRAQELRHLGRELFLDSV